MMCFFDDVGSCFVKTTPTLPSYHIIFGYVLTPNDQCPNGRRILPCCLPLSATVWICANSKRPVAISHNMWICAILPCMALPKIQCGAHVSTQVNGWALPCKFRNVFSVLLSLCGFPGECMQMLNSAHHGQALL